MNSKRLGKPPLHLHRPFRFEYSPQAIVNRVLPWFDLIVGGLLLVGLFTRLASAAALLFLISVVLSQPFWVEQAADTWLQWIEIAGLAVLFSTCAGRFGGLDFFLHRLWGRQQPLPNSAGSNREHPSADRESIASAIN